MEKDQSTSSPFRMTVGDHSVIGHPTPSDIQQTLRMLDDSADGFLILERGPQFFMQCAGTTATGFFVEYREGQGDLHFRSADESVSLGTTTGLLVSYLMENGRWREMIRWEPLNTRATEPLQKPKKKRPRLIERHGDAIVINKRWCLIAAGGLVCYALGIVLFTGTSGSRLSGLLLVGGTACLILSSFTDD